MTALERIKELEKNPEWYSEQEGFVNPEDCLYFALKAFRVMREITIELQNQNLYRQYLNGKLKRKDLKQSENHVDQSFEISMRMKDEKEKA